MGHGKKGNRIEKQRRAQQAGRDKTQQLNHEQGAGVDPLSEQEEKAPVFVEQHMQPQPLPAPGETAAPVNDLGYPFAGKIALSDISLNLLSLVPPAIIAAATFRLLRNAEVSTLPTLLFSGGMSWVGYHAAKPLIMENLGQANLKKALDRP